MTPTAASGRLEFLFPDAEAGTEDGNETGESHEGMKTLKMYPSFPPPLLKVTIDLSAIIFCSCHEPGQDINLVRENEFDLLETGNWQVRGLHAGCFKTCSECRL